MTVASVQEIFIVSNGAQAILGLQACETLGIIARQVDNISQSSSEGVVKEFCHLFAGTGCLQHHYRMVLRVGALLVVQTARGVPLALREPLRKELDRMEREGIIVKVTEPTESVSPLVIARKKDGKLRVCRDPRKINEAIKREHFEMPRREYIESELAGAKVFTRLDANSGLY